MRAGGKLLQCPGCMPAVADARCMHCSVNEGRNQTLFAESIREDLPQVRFSPSHKALATSRYKPNC